MAADRALAKQWLTTMSGGIPPSVRTLDKFVAWVDDPERPAEPDPEVVAFAGIGRMIKGVVASREQPKSGPLLTAPAQMAAAPQPPMHGPLRHDAAGSFVETAKQLLPVIQSMMPDIEVTQPAMLEGEQGTELIGVLKSLLLQKAQKPLTVEYDPDEVEVEVDATTNTARVKLRPWALGKAYQK